jgi:HK97 family phage major capsid protein
VVNEREEETMEPEQEVLELARELRDTIGTRLGAIERRLGRVEKGRPGGYVPDDQGEGERDGDGRRVPEVRGALELGARDSFAGWLAREQGVLRAAPGEFSLGRLVQAMWSGDRSRLTELERQALSEGSDSSGGVLIGGAQAGAVIDYVRPKVAVLAAGGTVVPMAAESLVYPKVLTPATPEWKAELAPMTESSLTFGSLTLTAKTLRTKVKISEELVEDMTPEGSAAVDRELTNAFALELDRVALLGSGVDPEPRGVKNTPGVLTIAAVGAPANYDFLAAAVTAVRGQNHEPNAYILGAAAAGALDQLTASDGQPLQPPASVSGMDEFVTNLVSGDAFVGEWPLLVLGVRPQLGVRLRTVEAALAQDFSVEIVAWQRADVGLMDAKAFCVASGITAAQTVEVGEIPEDSQTKKAKS